MDSQLLVGSIFERKYRVDRVVAEGGFGIVYAALHLALGTQVALKVLRPQLRLSRDDWTDHIHQFREEATALTRLRRSHVVQVLDSGIAALDDDPAGLPWMTLEWLDGETLHDYLAARRRAGERGRTALECMNLLRPVLEAIADAHEIGIAHRDLKPKNIMLVPTKSGLVPRVLDFGIAKMMESGHDEAATGDTATDSRTTAFTAASAAPEQLAGSRTGPWTDVYALGLLLTEVLADRAPIAAETAQERYRIAFGDVRPTPASLGVDVGAWEPILLRALAVTPKERPRDARALLAELDRALGGDAVTDSPLTRDTGPASGLFATVGKRRATVRLALLAIGAGVVVAAVGIGGRVLRSRPEPVLFAAAARPLVVVSELRAAAHSGDERRAGLVATFAELLSAQLRVGDAMRIPAPEARAVMLEASGIAGAPAITKEALARLRAATGADVLIGGEIDDANGTLRADIDLYDAASGARLGSLTLSAPASDVNAFVREAGARVRRALGRPALSIEDESALRAILPENPEASMAYVAGFAARRTFHFRDAAAHFEKATALAPTFAPAFAALAHARLNLGHGQAAREAAEIAVRLAPALPRGDELEVYALAAETRNDWEGAVENYRTLAQFYPDRIDYVTSLARALVGAGKAADALVLLDGAKKRPQSDWDLVRIALVASFAHSKRSEDPASIADAEEAERLAAKVGARVLVADAVLAQAHVRHRAGRLDDAEALFGRARAVYADVGDDDNLLNCDSALAEIAAVRGDYPHAIEIGERLVEAYRASGNGYRHARLTVTLCLIHAAAGHLAKARELCDEGGHRFEAVNDREGEAWRLLNLADLDLKMGRIDGVVDALARGRAKHAEIGQRAGVATADMLLARAAWTGGHLAEAEAGFASALSEASSAGESGLRAEIALDRARLAFARSAPDEHARFDDAVELTRASSDARFIALLDVLAARRALVAGDVAEARRRAVAAEEGARKGHAPDAIALALAVALDAFAPRSGAPPLQDDRAPRRAELATRVDALETVEVKVEALLALSRAATGAQATELAERATRIAREHGLVALEQLGRRAFARSHGAR